MISRNDSRIRSRHHRRPSNRRWLNRYGNLLLVKLPILNCRIVIGPHWLGVVVTLFLINGGTSMNLKLLKRNQWLSINTKSLISVYITVAYILTHLFLLLTACSDAGIVYSQPTSRTRSDPRGLTITHQHEPASECDIELASAYDRNTDQGCVTDDKDDELPAAIGSPTLLTEEVSGFIDRGDEGDMCPVCEIYRPAHLKIYHCSDCGCCFEFHDHHCPWMGQCIAGKNMMWFLLFNATWVLFFAEFIYIAFTTP